MCHSEGVALCSACHDRWCTCLLVYVMWCSVLLWKTIFHCHEALTYEAYVLLAGENIMVTHSGIPASCVTYQYSYYKSRHVSCWSPKHTCVPVVFKEDFEYHVKITSCTILLVLNTIEGAPVHLLHQWCFPMRVKSTSSCIQVPRVHHSWTNPWRQRKLSSGNTVRSMYVYVVFVFCCALAYILSSMAFRLTFRHGTYARLASLPWLCRVCSERCGHRTVLRSMPTLKQASKETTSFMSGTGKWQKKIPTLTMDSAWRVMVEFEHTSLFKGTGRLYFL